MAQILITKPGTLTKADRAKLRAVDVVVVEADDPSSVKLITTEGAELAAGDMLFAAMAALNSGENHTSGARSAFAKAILDLLAEKRAESTP